MAKDKNKSTKAEATEETTKPERVAKTPEQKVTPIHEAQAAFIKETTGHDVDPVAVFLVNSTRARFRKQSELYAEAKGSLAERKEAEAAAKAEAAEAREAAKAEKAEAAEKAKAEKAEAKAAEKAERDAEKAKAAEEKKAAAAKAKEEKAKTDTKSDKADKAAPAKGGKSTKGKKGAAPF